MTFVVDSVLDTVDSTDGVTTLREAILAANANPGKDRIEFNIPGSGVHTILPATSLPPIDEPVVIDGYSQPGARPNSLADGNDAVLLIELSGTDPSIQITGIRTHATGTEVRGLVINGFGHGIWIGSHGNLIEGNFIGTDPTGQIARGNNAGIGQLILHTNDNVIGGIMPESRNVISGNKVSGIGLMGSDNRVEGNFIGTDATGTLGLGNGQVGVNLQGQSNTVGGLAPGARNIISGNNVGVHSVSVVQGNFIGTDVTGTIAIGNATGVSNSAQIGGTVPEARNIISGNGNGIVLLKTESVVQGNFIGTDATGTVAVGNTDGVFVQFLDSFAGGALIGGTVPGAGNVISGNTGAGVRLSGGTQHWVEGNYIGTNAAGTSALRNIGVFGGILMETTGAVIGGTDPGARNIIGDGIFFRHATTTENRVIGNWFGLNVDGEQLGTNSRGIGFGEGASNNYIGGTLSGEGNVIAYSNGVTLCCGSTTNYPRGNSIRGNSIYMNGGLGINFYGPHPPGSRTANDALDVDEGPNDLQNYPELASAASAAGQVTINGLLHSTPDTSFEVDFYANSAPDPSGYGEGERYLGYVTVTTDSAGNATVLAQFSGVVVGEYITATATNPGRSTSEFSAAIEVVDPPFSVLSGSVFGDLNNDGQKQSSESGIAGVTVTLSGTDANGQVSRTTTTDVFGAYAFAEVLPGTYSITADQPVGLLDGQETAGTLGGTVDNTQDSNVISDIVVSTGGLDGTGYNFAEIRPSEIIGLVWQDFNNDALVNFGEKAIPGVSISLAGTDDRGNSVSFSANTDSDGIYAFFDLRPGTYTISETQPAGFDDGRDVLGTVNGVTVGGDSVNDVFSGVVLALPDSVAQNYNFGERPAAGGQVLAGQTATIGFWQNSQGQALIESLNGGPNATQLSSWLAASFPNMYGASAGANNIAGHTNEQVADFYSDLFRRKKKEADQLGLGGPVKVDAQVMAVAFATYVTNLNLAAAVAADYGFLVTEHGVGTALFNVGDSGEAFGVADYTDVAELDLLFATNDFTVQGVLYDRDGDGDASDSLETLLRTLANDLYSAINEQGDI